VFLAFALGTLALSFITALLFSLFWIGIALFVLVPTLFITVSLGIVLWVWAVSSFLVARWVYNIVPSKSHVSTIPGDGKVVKSESDHGNSIDTTKNGFS
jgi:membrane protein implicated in regulation of membrane protease activity